MVLRAVETEKILRDRKLTRENLRAAQDVLAREIAPIDDMRSTARYRGRIAQNLLAEFCATLPA
jgi:xanthine dehydrogenase iron-sulfur cluster and FAD-binding subunit A